jgi:hypothetical protein
MDALLNWFHFTTRGTAAFRKVQSADARRTLAWRASFRAIHPQNRWLEDRRGGKACP